MISRVKIEIINKTEIMGNCSRKNKEKLNEK